MKNLDNINQQKVFIDLQKIYNQIFSIPSKRVFISFYELDHELSSIFVPVHSFPFKPFILNNKTCCCVPFTQMVDMKKEFGDLFVVYYYQSTMENNNTIILGDSISSEIEEHKSIVITSNFLTLNSMMITIREAILDYMVKSDNNNNGLVNINNNWKSIQQPVDISNVIDS